jgi:adenylate cyclase
MVTNIMSAAEPHTTTIANSGLAMTMPGTWPVKARNFLARHLELFFVIVIAAMVMVVFYYAPYKIAFLNFFYLPVLVAAHFMGKRRAVLGATFCILLVIFFSLLHPSWFAVEGTRLNTLLLISTWGGFLILTSAGVGTLQEKLAERFEAVRQLNEERERTRLAEETKSRMQKTLESTMDTEVARLATEGRLRFEKREISIMFTDLTNFTSYSDKNQPDVVLDELNKFLGHIEPIVDMFHGHIDKYMGDGVMVEFGAPVDYDRHALLAVLAGVKMQEKINKLDLPWKMRVGIATGSTIIGMLGVRRQAYSALGDRVNIAKRLEEICEPGKVFIDEPTFRAIEPFVEATKLRNMGYSRQSDRDLLEHMSLLEEKLNREGETPDLLYELGKIHYELRDATAAIQNFERALALDPNSTKIKLAYADANIKKDEFEKIQLKGKLQKITVYEVKKIKDRWSDPAVIPPALAEKYRAIEALIDIPEEVVIPTEALDGSIGHCRVVALLSYLIADYLKLNEDLKRTILRAGYVQDVGKKNVSHYILNRPSSLDPDDAKGLQKYVEESTAILRSKGYGDPQLLEIVLHHHECWDGSGYPDGLSGEAIPIGARITVVAEAYSALTSWRPYHDAWDKRVALSELDKGVKKGRYDPKVVDAVAQLFKLHSA